MAAPPPAPAVNIYSKPEQARLLTEARDRVKHSGFLMKRSVVSGPVARPRSKP